MALLNPWFLLGSLALAVPVLIHLVRREKSEIVPFGSLMFLLRVPKQAIRQQKLKNLLLMALRLLILALLVGAFARPYATSPVTPAATGDAARGTVLLLDTSYSMQYGTTFERMKNEAMQRIDALEPGERMAIVAFHESASILNQPTDDREALKAVVDAIEPSSAGTRYYEAFAAADRALSQLGTPEKRLVVISDFQRNGWTRSSRESVISHDVQTETVDLGIDNSQNVGIDSVGLDSTSFSREYAGRLQARLHNYRLDAAVDVPVVVTINDREAGRRTVSVPPNSTALVEFTGFDLPLGFSRGSVRLLVDDPLAADNEFLFTINRRDKLKLLIMDAGRARQSGYLRQAFTSTVELPFEMTVQAAPNVGAAELDDYDVVIVNDVPRLSDAMRDRLTELRRSGQGQIVIVGENADLGWWNQLPGFPLQLNRRIFVSQDRGKASYSLTTYDRAHSIFKPFERSTLALSSTQYFAYVEGEVRDGAAILARYENGSPVLVESSKEESGLLVFTSTVDNRWNDLPLKPTFLPWFHEMVSYLSRYSEYRGWYPMGEAIPLVGGVEAGAAAVILPDGERVALGDLASGQQRFFTTSVPGFHELVAGPDRTLVAVNPPSGEGNLERMPPDELVASVQRTQAEAIDAGFFTAEQQEDVARRQTWWWYLLLFALMAGIAEIYVANRAYGRQQG